MPRRQRAPRHEGRGVQKDHERKTVAVSGFPRASPMRTEEHNSASVLMERAGGWAKKVPRRAPSAAPYGGGGCPAGGGEGYFMRRRQYSWPASGRV